MGRTQALVQTLTAVLVLAMSIVLGGCNTSGGVARTEPAVRGVITSLDLAENAKAAHMLVVWTDDPDVGDSTDLVAAQVGIASDAIVERTAGSGDYERIEPSELQVGDIVEVWFTGPVRESYPGQADAERVRVTGCYAKPLPQVPGLGD